MAYQDPRELSKIDPELEEILKQYPNGRPQNFSPPEGTPLTVQWLRSLSSKAPPRPPCPPGITETEIPIPTRDNSNIILRIHRPSTPPTSGCPLFIMFHGGGACIGDLDSRSEDCRMMVLEEGCCVVNVGYRLAPEFPFPVGNDDSWEAVVWASKNYASINANPSLGFLIGGDSSGATTSATLAIRARDANLEPPLTGCLLSIPCTVNPKNVPERWRSQHVSHEQNYDAPFYGGAMQNCFMEAYKPDPSSEKQYALLAASHKDLPRSYIQVCGMDPLRDDGLIYAQVLKENGVETKLDIYPGLPHSFWAFLPKLKASQKWREDFKNGLKWLLRRDAGTA